MNRNQAKELLPIIKAFSEGKVIEMKCAESWIEIEDVCDFHSSSTFRIKPEPKYSPFKDADECWQEMQKHQPFGWVKCKEDGSLGLITLIISEENIFINGVGCNSERTMRGFTFADGTPFGILEED